MFEGGAVELEGRKALWEWWLAVGGSQDEGVACLMAAPPRALPARAPARRPAAFPPAPLPARPTCGAIFTAVCIFEVVAPPMSSGTLKPCSSIFLATARKWARVGGR